MPIDLADSVLTVDEAAEFARVKPEKIRAWFDEGLRHMQTADNENKTGPRKEIVRKSALLEFIESREVGKLANRPEPKDAGGKPKKPPRSGSGQVDPKTWVAGRR